MTGLFITFEGMEGAGKSTQITRLSETLSASGHDVVVTREPGGTDGAERIRQLLVTGEGDAWGASAECLLMNAARADHLERLIRPALADGKTVLCDRFMDSTRAYQGGAGKLAMDDILAIEDTVVGETRPDLTLIFDIDPAEGLARAGKRGGYDRFERKGLAYHEQVRAAFRRIAEVEPERCVLIDAAPEPDAVTAQIEQALQQRGISG